MLNLAKHLRPLSPPIPNKRLNILPQNLHSLPHLPIKRLRLRSPRQQLIEHIMHLPIPRHDAVPLPQRGFVLRLLRADPLVLQQVAVGSGEFFHEGVLFVVCLQEAGLVGAEFFEFGGEEVGFLACYGFFVED